MNELIEVNYDSGKPTVSGIYEQLKAVGILPLIEQNDEEETA